MNFEEKIRQLEEIVSAMEDSSTSLSEGIDLYSQGIEITKECLAILNDGKERIKALQSEMSALFEGESHDGSNDII